MPKHVALIVNKRNYCTRVGHVSCYVHIHVYAQNVLKTNKCIWIYGCNFMTW